MPNGKIYLNIAPYQTRVYYINCHSLYKAINKTQWGQSIKFRSLSFPSTCTIILDS